MIEAGGRADDSRIGRKGDQCESREVNLSGTRIGLVVGEASVVVRTRGVRRTLLGNGVPAVVSRRGLLFLAARVRRRNGLRRGTGDTLAEQQGPDQEDRENGAQKSTEHFSPNITPVSTPNAGKSDEL